MAEPKIWTTAADSDECGEYDRSRAPRFQHFEVKEQCEAWVKQRHCRPGRICSDGCNQVACDSTGMKLTSTLMECGVAIGEDIEFRAKTTEPKATPDWEELARSTERVFRVPNRTLKITGFALPGEAPSNPAGQRQLARRRAELVRKQLTSRGVDPKRLSIELGVPSQLGVEGYRSGSVLFQLNPSEPQPEDFDPDSPQYAELCAVKGKALPASD